MNQIIDNLNDPSWWFTGIFFIVVGIVITKLVLDWSPKAWLRLSNVQSTLSNKLRRCIERRILIRVKRHRQHQVKVNWLIGRYWSLATVAIIYLFGFSILYTFSSDFHGSAERFKYFSLILLPGYVFILFIAWEKRVLKRTIDSHIQWNKSNKSRQHSVVA